MKLNILSRSISVPSTRRLVEVARQRGHKVSVLNPVTLEMYLDPSGPKLFRRGKPVSLCDVVIPRIAHSISPFGLSVVSQFELQGAIVLNSAQAIGQARNQMRCLQLLAQNGIAIPATMMVKDASDAARVAALIGDFPVVLRLLQGHERRGLIICESLQSMQAALQAALGLGQNLIVQQYVRPEGKDIRVLVVGGRAIAGVRRVPKVGKLARKLSSGARLIPVRLTSAQANLASRTSQLIGLQVAAVDLIEMNGDWQVFEVNSSPAIHEMESATQRDLTSPIVELAESLVGMPDEN